MSRNNFSEPAVWFPAIRASSGTDVFTERLAAALLRRGIRADISWLPHYAEYAPWMVRRPRPPAWANIAHCNSWLHYRLLPQSLPLVVTLHSCVHDTALAPYKSLAQRLYHRHWVLRIETAALASAQQITAVSRYTATRAAEVFERSDIEPIYNWIDTAAFQRAQRHAPGRPLRLLFVGNLNARKGADLLPEIMRRLGEGFVLHYTGTPQDFGHQTSLPTNMVGLGRLKSAQALVEAYQASDALLFPTRLEGFGLCALEAQACGLPVIATRCSSVPEVVQDGKTALLCPVDNVEAFARSAKRLRDEPGLWARLSKAAVDRAKVFSEEATVRRYLEIYRELIQKPVRQK